MHRLKKFLPPIILTLIVSLTAIWYFAQTSRAEGETLQASGTIEAVEVQVSPELAGRVIEVMVDKGDHVQAGDPLFRMDDVLLQSQRERANAALDSARAGLKSAQVGLESAQAGLTAARASQEAAESKAQVELLAAQQALDSLYENADLARATAARGVAEASRAVREATYLLDNFTIPTEQSGLTAMEALMLMKERLDDARDAFEPYRNTSSSDPTRQDLKEALDQAQSDYDAAVRRMEYETQVGQAEARLTKAIEDLKTLQDGPNPDDLAMVEAQIEAIQAGTRQYRAAVEQAEVSVALAQARLEAAANTIEQAQAELDLIDVQIGKLLITAPSSGVVISRNLEPGEIIQPAASVMTIGQLDQLTITVYIPEDRYGQVNLGQSVIFKVDSFPNETFSAAVVHIADQAEFTPRNVQTAEGRKSTVFAVSLSIINSQSKLKPGMPADVLFEN